MGRAWCVAEVAEMWDLGMPQSLIMFSEIELTAHIAKLRRVKVEECQASREEDKLLILAKISDVAEFDRQLQDRFFGQTGLFARWSNGESDIAFFASVAGWLAEGIQEEEREK